MTPRRPIRVLLVDDSADQREGFRMLLGSQPDLEVVAQAGDGAQALGILRREHVDVVLMDVQMPRVNGLVAAGRILADPQVRGLGRAPRIVLLATVDVDDHVPAAAVSGAYAILYKDVDPESLFTVIREAAAFRGDD
ncbi:response regulator [Protaetiibacter larvae]|uniref:Response regulator transcription factor n=1 Tax=Protaetiibacter larvae TaxID=2592654 RepID=A0A5C1YBG4_9MICO|nr:response regulator transcription factor [Protaetiibacter larvae]QEO10232.1 response regulator transcription factor [Protaetiibacter larvae]